MGSDDKETLKTPLASVLPVPRAAPTSAPVLGLTAKILTLAPLSRPLAAVPAITTGFAAVRLAVVVEVADPGSGFFTEKVTLPALVTVTVAVREVGLATVAATLLLPKTTCAPETKLAPVTVMPVATPTSRLPPPVTATLVTVAIGFNSDSETPAEVTPPALAVMVTVVGFASAVAPTAGGVYLPMLSMVPVVALPPATPFTAQV